MADPSPTIMGAYHRQSGEDRATEVLATVLQRVPAFLAELTDRLGLPRAEAYRVATQVRSGCVIDLEVQAQASPGQAGWLLWSEHKVNAPLTTEQLVRESTALTAKAGALPSQLIAVTLYPPVPRVHAEASAIAVQLLRWRDLFEMAQRAANELSSAGRRSELVAPNSLGVQGQLLLEWCEFCENELEAPVGPLTSHRVEILRDAEKATETLAHLLEVGFRLATDASGAGVPKERDEEQHAAPPPGTWLEQRGCRFYARYDLDDSWSLGGIGRPAVVVGMFAEDDDAQALRRDRELHQLLEEREFSHWDEQGKHGAGSSTARHCLSSSSLAPGTSTIKSRPWGGSASASSRNWWRRIPARAQGKRDAQGKRRSTKPSDCHEDTSNVYDAGGQECPRFRYTRIAWQTRSATRGLLRLTG